MGAPDNPPWLLAFLVAAFFIFVVVVAVAVGARL